MERSIARITRRQLAAVGIASGLGMALSASNSKPSAAGTPNALQLVMHLQAMSKDAIANLSKTAENQRSLVAEQKRQANPSQKMSDLMQRQSKQIKILNQILKEQLQLIGETRNSVEINCE